MQVSGHLQSLIASLQVKEQLQHNGREEGPASDPVW